MINWINWIYANNSPPPFNIYLLLDMDGYWCVGKVVKGSPNDDGEGTEFNDYQNESDKYEDFQFYVVPMHEDWQSHVAEFEEIALTDYSDRIVKWAQI